MSYLEVDVALRRAVEQGSSEIASSLSYSEVL